MILTFEKAKARPTWSISPDGKRFKNPQGKWVPRKGQGKQSVEKPPVKLTIKPKAKYYDPKKDWKDNGVKSKVFKDWFGDWEKGEGSKVTTKTGKPEKQFNTGSIEPIKMYHGTGSGSFSEFDLGHSNTGVLLYGGGFYFTANKDVAETYRNNNASKVYDFNVKFTADELSNLHMIAQETAYASAKKYLPDPLESTANKTKFLQTLAYMFNRKDLDDYTGFGKKLRSQFNSLRKNLTVKETDKSNTFEVYLNIRKPFDIDKDTISGKALGLSDKPYTYMQAVETMHFRKYHKPTTPVGEKLAEFKDKIQSVLKDMGHDGITHIGGRVVGKGETPEHRVWIAFNAEDIKSSDNEGTFDTSQKNIYKSVKLVVPFIKGHKKENIGAVTVWADGSTHRKTADGKWITIKSTRSKKQDKPKVAKKKLEIAIGKRGMSGEIKSEYEASVEDSPIGHTIGGLLEYQYGAKDYEALSALVARSDRGKLSEIFRTVKDAVDAMNENPKKGSYVTRGQKRFHVDMLGRALLKLKQIHEPEKERLTVPVKLKTGNVKGVYVKPVVGIPAVAMKEARAMTGGWKSGKKTPTSDQVNAMIKLKKATLVKGTIDPKLKWSITPLTKNHLIPFRVEETGITVKIRQYQKAKGKKKGYSKAIVDLHVPYAYAVSFLKNNMKSVRTRNEMIGQMERSKGYRRTILKEKGLK